MTKFVRFVFAISVATTLHFNATAQSVSINTTGATADPSAILDVTSTTKGMLIPRMTKAQKTAIATPATGLLIYQTSPDSLGFQYYDGAQWIWLSGTSDSTAWKITGNANITSSNFLGTTNDSALHFRVRNIPSGIVDSISGNTALGYSALRTNNGGFANIAIGRNAMQSNRNGSYNTVTGFNALLNNDSSYYTTAIGYNAMVNHRNGYWNTAVGMQSLYSDSIGQQNTAIGVQALYLNKTSSYSTAVGTNSLYYNLASNNTAVGHSAGLANSYTLTDGTSGIENTAIGYQAGYGNWSGNKNTSLGFRALFAYQSGTVWATLRNTAIGDSAMAYTLGHRNTAVGTEALSRAISSSNNVAVGDSSLGGALNTNGNVAIGYKTLSKQQGQGYNTAVGYFSQRDSSVNTIYNTSVGAYSMEYNRSGIYNTGLGLSALRNSDSSSYNTAVGADAMYYHRGVNSSNAAFGAFALRGDSTGFWNTAVGSEAMDRVGFDGTAKGSGFSNVAVGFRALRQIREGFENTALGVGALELDSSGNYNTAVGRYSGFLNKRGDYNVSMGYQSANDADTASAVVAIGSLALLRNKSDSNVAIGYRAGRTLGGNGAWAPTEATMIGNWAGDAAFVSSKNTAIGFRALAQRNAASGGSDYTGGGRNTAIGDSAMAWSVGISNVAIGAQAMPGGGVGVFNNVAIGDSAMGGASLVNDNVAIGYHSLKTSNYATSSNTGNTATGAYTGGKITSGYYNTINGYYAMENATTAAGVTAVGTSSFRYNISGFDNVGVGINSGAYVTSGANTFTGSYAGEGASGFSTGGSNTATGYFALNDIRSGNFNTAIGRQALFADTSGSYNVAVGGNALINNLASDFNTAVGYNSLLMHKRVGFTYNTGLGSFALETDSSGFFNTGVGTSAFRFNKTGAYNTGVGINAGYYQKDSYNTYVGGYSGFGLRSSPAYVDADTGNYNAGLGAYALHEIANGSNNVAVGYSALRRDSSGNLNTAVGNGALYSNTGSHTNQAFGWNALYSYNSATDGWNNAFGDRAAESLQTGTQNVAMGSWSMLGHTSGSLNTVIGNWAMGSGGSTGSSNTALGAQSLWRTNADGNVGIGTYAGQTNTTGTNNTFLGTFADVTTSGLTNATAIGYNARVAASNSLVLGASGTNVGINETSPNARLHIVRNGTSGGAFHASSSVIIEDNTSSYITLSNPNANENGILSANASNTIKGAIIFRADSSMQLRTGVNNTAITISNTQDVGIGTTTPAARLDVNGDFALGTNGTVLTQVIKETITGVTVPAVPANGTLAVDYAVPNAAVGGTVYVSPSTVLPTGVIIGYARVFSAGTVRVTYANLGGASSTATAGYSLYITVIN
jgi:hypothetical protein